MTDGLKVGTFGSRLRRRDASRFVGRGRERAVIDAIFAEEPVASILHIHGPGGIGKSALVREAARHAAARGWNTVWVDGRELAPVAEALEQALRPAQDLERPLVILDTYDRLSSLDTHLRTQLVPALPEKAVVLIAGRRGPSAAWFEGGLEHFSLELELDVLSPAESLQLVRRHGICDCGQAQGIVEWAGGSPLALTLAADAARVSPRWHPAAKPQDVLRPLARRILDAELDPARYDVLAVAAIARVVTPDLLRDVLVAEDANAAYAWLASRGCTERIGAGLALHDLVRRAVRAELRAADSERERELRRRIADSLHRRGQAGELLVTIDLAELAESPVISSGYSWQASQRFRLDPVVPADLEQVEAALRQRGCEAWWQGARPFFERAPELVSLARDVDGRVAGYSISVTPAGGPAFVMSDPVLGPRLEDARVRVPDGNVVLWREAWDLTGDPRSGVLPMLALAGILRSPLPNPRHVYLPIHTGRRAQLAFSGALDGRPLEQLGTVLHGLQVECHLVDFGPGGLLGAQRDLVYREIGLVPPSMPQVEGGEAIGPEAVRAALRAFHEPHRLAESPLAVGSSACERAQSVQRLLCEAIRAAFGDTAGEQLMRRAVLVGYVEGGGSLEAAAHELHLSRSAYFRRLRAASDRVAQHVLESRAS